MLLLSTEVDTTNSHFTHVQTGSERLTDQHKIQDSNPAKAAPKDSASGSQDWKLLVTWSKPHTTYHTQQAHSLPHRTFR